MTLYVETYKYYQINYVILMKSKILFVGVLLALLSLTFGTVGFSVLELEERSATVNVAADDTQGLLALQPGTPSVVEINDAGVLEINLADQLESDEGINPKSRLEIGNGNDDGSPAFTATNSYDQDIKLDLTVDNIQQPEDSNGNAVGQILVYQNGTEYDVTGSDTVPEITLTPTEAASYSLHFDTPGSIGTANAYNADLTFEVTEA